MVAVGTTSLRVLETAALAAAEGPGAADGRPLLAPLAGETRLTIGPGFRFRAADLLLTNFHAPLSTPLALACAFAGAGRLEAAYRLALAEGLRLLSFGDACLLERKLAPPGRPSSA